MCSENVHGALQGSRACARVRVGGGGGGMRWPGVGRRRFLYTLHACACVVKAKTAVHDCFRKIYSSEKQ